MSGLAMGVSRMASQYLAGLNAGAIENRLGGQGLLSGKLGLEYFQRSIAAGHHQALFCDQDLAGFSLAIHGPCSVNFELFPAEHCLTARPGKEGADLVVECPGAG